MIDLNRPAPTTEPERQYYFIKKVNPAYGIIMVGKDNKYGHPTKKTLDILNKYNVNIYRTDEEGTILMHLKGNDISFENFKTETNG